MTRNKIKVLQVNLDGRGGAYSLMRSIQDRISSDVQFDYYSMGNFNKSELSLLSECGSFVEDANLRTNRLFGHLLLPFSFRSFLKQSQAYDVVHIHADLAWKALLFAIPAKKENISKIIIHSHASAPNGDHAGLKYILHYAAKSILPYYSNIFVACSSLAREWMFPKSIIPRVNLLFNGVDLSAYGYSEIDRRRIRAELGICNNELLIGVVGDYSPVKNFPFALTLLEILNQRGISSKLIVIGDGEGRASFQNLVNDSEYRDDVYLAGSLTNVSPYYSAMDYFIMPSFAEGMPMSALEAQASGVHCLFSANISNEVAILPTSSFLPIDKGPEPWLSAFISSMYTKFDRSSAPDILKQAGFDICDTAVKIKEIYENF